MLIMDLDELYGFQKGVEGTQFLVSETDWD
jgi:hypothetical protein